MPVEKADGTANLRADHKVMSGSDTASPSGGGSDMGGTENKRADHKVMSAAGNTTPSASPDHRPAGLQKFGELGVK